MEVSSSSQKRNGSNFVGSSKEANFYKCALTTSWGKVKNRVYVPVHTKSKSYTKFCTEVNLIGENDV